MRPHLTTLTTYSKGRVILKDADVEVQCNGLQRLFEELLDDILECNWLQQYFGDRERFRNEVVLRRAKKIKFTSYTFQEPNKPKSVCVKCHGGSKGVMHPLWIRSSSSTEEDTFLGCIIRQPILFCTWIVPKRLTLPPHALTSFTHSLNLPMFRQHCQYGWIMEFMVSDCSECVWTSSLPDATTTFVTVRKGTNNKRACNIQSIEGPAYLVPAHRRKTLTIWHVNNHIDVETCWYIY